MNKEKALKNQGLEFREDIQVGGKITAMERALYQNSDIILSDESVQY